MEVLAADDGLVPWWFATAFWVAFAALVVIVARDVRRLGGVRRIVEELRRRFDDASGGDDGRHDGAHRDRPGEDAAPDRPDRQ